MSALLLQVQMRPEVNVVADKNSRIRTLEEEVRMLRSELAAKDTPSQLGTDNSSVSAPEVEEALQTQLARNEALTTEKETLARYLPPVLLAVPVQNNQSTALLCLVMLMFCAHSCTFPSRSLVQLSEC